MARKTQSMADLIAEEEARMLAEANTPERRAADTAQMERLAARRAEEHAKGVRLGWWDEDGNSLLPPDEDDEEDEE